MSEVKPKWRAEFICDVNRQAIPVLGDTGCTKSLISEEFFKKNRHLHNTSYRPCISAGRAINGTKVTTVGIVNVPFRLNGTYLHINCRIARGLIQPLILGWDFFCKYHASLDPSKGLLTFDSGKQVPLLPESPRVSGCLYRAHEDIIIPPIVT